MVLPGHIAGGYLATYALLSLAPASFSPAEIYVLYAIGMIASDSPDIDLVWFYLENKRKAKSTAAISDPVSGPTSDSATDSNHRNHITHTAVFWLGLSLIVWLVGYSISSIFTEFVAAAILAGSWTHLLLDSIEFGIRWLWPLSNKRFAIRKEIPSSCSQVIEDGKSSKDCDDNKYGRNSKIGGLAYYWQFIIRSYVKSPVFYIEILMVIIAVAVFVRDL